MHLTDSFHRLLNDFRSVFTNSSFLIFLNMMTGWVLSHHRRFVTNLIFFRTVLPKGRRLNKSIGQILDCVILAG